MKILTIGGTGTLAPELLARHESFMAVNGVRCMAGVKRLVYMSVHNVDQAPHLPHFGAKLRTPVDIERQTKLIGHARRSFEDFAAETAKMWNA